MVIFKTSRILFRVISRVAFLFLRDRDKIILYVKRWLLVKLAD